MIGNPWRVLTGAITPPPWRGESLVHHMSDQVPEHAPEVAAETEAPEPPPPMRKCTRCERELPLTDDFFYRKRRLANFRSDCKVCYRRRYGAENDEERS